MTQLKIPGLLFLFVAVLMQVAVGQRQMEDLDRGLVAVKVSNGVFLSWRVLGTEWRDVSYNLYRDWEKLNPEPITGASNYLDPSGTLTSSYSVAPLVNGIEQSPSGAVNAWENAFFDIPVRDIPGNYELNDASVGDLDGDGDLEIVVKRLPPDLSVEPLYTPLLEAYHLDGTWMWTIDLGPNRLNMKQINFIVCDMDGDGRAEVAVKTSEGNIDGTGVIIGDMDGDGITNYRSTAVGDDIIDGPEFLSIFEGPTGREVARTDYISRDPLSQWGLPGHTLEQLAHRADNNMMAVIYADGKRPTLVICRGIYHRTKMIALNYREGFITELWRFDSEDWPPEYTGQGNHNLSVADVDQDGRDEIIYGSMTVDDDGKGLYSTGLGHGDALHVSDMDPDRPGLEVWQAHEASPAWGGTYRDARNGEVLLQYVGNRDMGRACAGDITAGYRGFEMWGATECPIYNCNGHNLGPTNIPVNFMVWWDGDLLREFLDHNWLGDAAGVGIGTISKYDGSGAVNLLTANGTYSTNHTKGNPCLQADILGDWREEVIWRTTDNRYLRIYTTTIPTMHRIYTLMHDPQYRLAIAWQNNAYNQPPHPGYYLADGMDSVPPPPVTGRNLVWHGGSSWDVNTTTNWMKGSSLSVYHNGDSVLFDILGQQTEPILLEGTLLPSAITVNAPGNYIFDGSGRLSGPTGLLKTGSGSLTIHTDNDYTGITRVWEGSLFVDGSLEISPVYIKRFARAGGKGLFGKGITIEQRGGLVAGHEQDADTLRIKGHLDLRGNAACYFDLSDDTTGTVKTNDIIFLDGDLSMTGKNIFNINALEGTLQKGTYTLIVFSGTFTGNLSDIEVRGIPGIPYRLLNTGNTITIRFPDSRDPARIIWTGSAGADWDLAITLNWLNNGVPDWFVGNDTVVFNNTGIPNTTVHVTGTMPVGQMVVDASADYSFSGNGSISGPGGLLKKGTGKLVIDTQNDYTGPTVVEDGILEIAGFRNAGYPSAVGASGDSPENLVLDGGTLCLSGTESATDRSITIGNAGGTVDIPSAGSNHRILGPLTGAGRLVKTGSGTLALGSANSYQGGTLLKKGTIKLESEEANTGGFGTGPLTIESGRIMMLDNQNSYTNNCAWDIIVPANGTAWLHLDSRSSLTGSLTGSGTLNLFTPFIRSELYGNWSAFAGKISVTTDSDGGWFLIANSGGMPSASVSLGDQVTLLYRPTSSVMLEIGELSGTTSSRIGAGGEGSSTVTWKVGALNTHAVFDGIICNDQFKNTGAKASVIKTGTGSWTLTGENTYSGQTTVEAGMLLLANTAGSGTGSGPVVVKSGALLGGTGAVNGKVTLESGSYLAPGINSFGTFSVNNDVVLSPGSFLCIEVDMANKLSDLLKVNGQISLGGYLYIMNTGPLPLAAGDSIKVTDALTCSGWFDQILPAKPGNGLAWDTTGFCRTGVIRVLSVTGPDMPESQPPGADIYPNPSHDRIFIRFPGIARDVTIILQTIEGQTVSHTQHRNVVNSALDISHCAPGIYILRIRYEDHWITRKIIKK